MMHQIWIQRFPDLQLNCSTHSFVFPNQNKEKISAFTKLEVCAL